MKIMIQATNMDLTPSIKSFVEDKVGLIAKILSAKDDDLAEARVEIGRPSKHHHTGAVYQSEVNVKIGKRLFRAQARHEDLYASVNLTRDEIERQIMKQKTKEQSARRKARKVS